MLKYEWTRFVCMASETDRVLRRAGAQLPRQEAAVRIVTIAACDQSFVYAMVVGFREIRFNLKMAAVTQLRLARLH